MIVFFGLFKTEIRNSLPKVIDRRVYIDKVCNKFEENPKWREFGQPVVLTIQSTCKEPQLEKWLWGFGIYWFKVGQ